MKVVPVPAVKPRRLVDAPLIPLSAPPREPLLPGYASQAGSFFFASSFFSFT
jgi:hypothetical protein